jgi:hypothetical protein
VFPLRSNLETKADFQLATNLGESLERFFKDLSLLRLPLEIAVLDTKDYDTHIDNNSVAKLYTQTIHEEAKRTSLGEVGQNTFHKVYVRRIRNQVGLTSIIDALLMAYYPKVSQGKLETATPVIERAFRCYYLLLNEPSLRDLLVELCRRNDAILDLANLPARS